MSSTIKVVLKRFVWPLCAEWLAEAWSGGSRELLEEKGGEGAVRRGGPSSRQEDDSRGKGWICNNGV